MSFLPYLPKQLRQSLRSIKCNQRLKRKILTYYGKNKTLHCCWPHCTIIDIDMLTIDHIKNNGHKHRMEIKATGGNQFYRWLKHNNFPTGFQTLCMNHQLKKRRILERKQVKQRTSGFLPSKSLGDSPGPERSSPKIQGL
jgi:hypothetical protein